MLVPPGGSGGINTPLNPDLEWSGALGDQRAAGLPRLRLLRQCRAGMSLTRVVQNLYCFT